MARAYAYLFVAGVVWLVEGVLFSYFLAFATWQVVLMVLIYLGLYAFAIRVLVGSGAPTSSRHEDVSAWRYVTLAPMIVVIVGSFASLPLMLILVLLGKLA